jgi:hypothetical protein
MWRAAEWMRPQFPGEATPEPPGTEAMLEPTSAEVKRLMARAQSPPPRPAGNALRALERPESERRYLAACISIGSPAPTVPFLDDS